MISITLFCSCQSEVLQIDNIYEYYSTDDFQIKNKPIPLNTDSLLVYQFVKLINDESSNPSSISKVLSKIELQISHLSHWSKFYQDFLIYYQNFEDSIENFSINELDYHLDSLSQHPKNKILYINLLDIKSKRLNEQSLNEYAIATSLYSTYLRSTLPNHLKHKPYYIEYAILATIFDKEDQTQLAKHYYKKATEKTTSWTDGSRFVHYFHEIQGKKVNAEYFEDLKARYIDSTKINNKTNKIIETDLSLRMEGDFIISKTFESLALVTDYCESYTFYQITYLIDDLIKESRYEEAENWIKELVKCQPSGIEEYLVKFRTLNLLSKLNDNKPTKKRSLEILKKSQDLKRIFIENGEKILNKHFADVIFKNNREAINAIYNLGKIDDLHNYRQLIIDELDKFKLLFSRISDSKSHLTGKLLNKKFLKNYSKIRIDLERLELKINKYQDTLHSDLSIYENIYYLHKELNDLKNTLEIDTNFKTIDLKINNNYSIHPETQIIDIVMTNNDYYLTSITEKKIEMVSFSKESLENILNPIIPKNKYIAIPNQQTIPTLKEFIDTTKKNLYIIPDGIFFNMPFEIISPNFFNTSKINLSYHSSVGSCLAQKNNLIKPNISLYSFSDEQSIKDNRAKVVPELPIGYEEIKAIKRIYNNQILLAGSEFSNMNLPQNLSTDILHFSSHSYSSQTVNLKNYIITRGLKNEYDHLYGFELKQYELNNKIIILSSCNSGTGVQKPGTGVFSLSRDFLQAGAQTVIKSLWAVNEASTKELMVEMHRNFTSGQSIGEALTNAKRKVKEMPGYEHPYYWAGFVLEGNPHVYLDLSENNN